MLASEPVGGRSINFFSKYMHIIYSVYRHSCLHFKIVLYIYFQETTINIRLLFHSKCIFLLIQILKVLVLLIELPCLL